MGLCFPTVAIQSLSHGLQHARLPCPSLSPRVCSNSCPLSWWCHPAISSSVAPFSSCPHFSKYTLLSKEKLFLGEPQAPAQLITHSLSFSTVGGAFREDEACLFVRSPRQPHGSSCRLWWHLWAESVFYILNGSGEKKNQKKDVLWCMEMTWDSNFSVPN